ncbi:unnamed protein product [Lactuca virosa]|uniref:Uncharacterized protein n=1 Tax=Lactuca virosa TaxID=75947 RepID=A0AAU9PL35_9ASTR|nr:unnamed protein product [Lactuca virosa]
MQHGGDGGLLAVTPSYCHRSSSCCENEIGKKKVGLWWFNRGNGVSWWSKTSSGGDQEEREKGMYRAGTKKRRKKRDWKHLLTTGTKYVKGCEVCSYASVLV